LPIALHPRADTRPARVGVFEVPYPLILLHLRADTGPARGVVEAVHVTGRVMGKCGSARGLSGRGVIHEAGRVAA